MSEITSDHPFGTFPHNHTIPVSPYKVNVTQDKLDDLRRRLDDAPKPRRTFENSTTDEPVGVKYDWMTDAIEKWKVFDWRKTEAELNAFPQFQAKVDHNGDAYSVHFLSLFSKNKDAVPVIFAHGWPGSVLEFVPLLKLLSEEYTPETLPIHAIVPSLIGYGFSSPPPIDKNFVTGDNAHIFDTLMRGLGFDRYIAQGGDVGSLVVRFMGQNHDACKAVHVNLWNSVIRTPAAVDTSSFDAFDKDCMERWEEFNKWEFAYKHEQGTKAATLSFALESSPVALLSWIGEKMIVWSDETPSLDLILSNVTIYWVQNTISTGFYHYRSTAGRRATSKENDPKPKVPIGYSLFKKEIIPIPYPVAKDSGLDLVWFNRHDQGGHFAALERPVEFWEDVLAFTKQVWK